VCSVLEYGREAGDGRMWRGGQSLWEDIRTGPTEKVSTSVRSIGPVRSGPVLGPRPRTGQIGLQP
jgi:hypothetical protein